MKTKKVMKTKKITANQIIQKAELSSAKQFDAYLNKKGIEYSVLDCDNIIDLNEGFYNVQMLDHELTVLFCDGQYQDYSEA